MMQSEFVASLADLRYIEIHCTNCSTKVTLDMSQPSEFAEKYGEFAPKACPGCRKDYDSAIRPAVNQFQRAYGLLSAGPNRVIFRGVVSASREAI